jgi:hypothetical protein
VPEMHKIKFDKFEEKVPFCGISDEDNGNDKAEDYYHYKKFKMSEPKHPFPPMGGNGCLNDGSDSISSLSGQSLNNLNNLSSNFMNIKASNYSPVVEDIKTAAGSPDNFLDDKVSNSNSAENSEDFNTKTDNETTNKRTYSNTFEI